MNKNIITLVLSLLFFTGMNAQIDRSQQPKPGPAPKVNIGKPESFTLKNGLKVLIVENHKLPRVRVTLTLDNPPILEGDKMGVKDILSSMMGNGTSKISKDDFNEEIDFYGARVSFGNDYAFATTLSKYFPEILNLLAQGATDPLLVESEFNSEMDKLKEGIKADAKNVPSVAGKLKSALVYGINHPFGEFMHEKNIDNLKFQDVINYYNTNFVPNNAYLVIVGDVQAKNAKKLVKKAFKKWEGTAVARGNYSEPTNLSQAEIDFVDMPNAVQSEIAALNLTHLKYTDSDYFAVLLANQILGGGGEGRLFLNLREAHGWTYGSYSRISADKEVGRFGTSASVRNSVTDSAIVEMINEIKRIRTEPVSAEELKNAKAKYIGNFVMEVEKPEVIARQALRTETQSLTADYYENFIKNIEAVTPEQIMKAAQKYFALDNTRIVVVGKGEEVIPTLKQMNYPIRYFNRFGEEIEEPVYKKPLPEGLNAQKVMDNYLAAIGGKEKAQSLKSYKADFIMTGAAPMPLQGIVLKMAPNMSLMEMKMNGQTVMRQAFDGTTLRVSGMMGNQEKTGEDVADQAAKKGIIEQAFYTPEQMELLSISQVNGKDAYKVKVTEGGKSKEEYYDTQTGLLIQTIEVQESPQGSMSLVSSLSDYQEVEGIKIPMKSTIVTGPQTMEMTYSNVELNKGVSAEDFK